MEKDWVKVFSSPDVHVIEILKAILKEENIEAISINKRDSSYPTFGEIELYVSNSVVLQAKRIINKSQDEQLF